MIFNKPELRELLYKEKSLDDFDIDSEGSIFYRFFEVLLTLDGTKVTDLNIEKKITDMFNDACYICTIALIIKRPALKLGHFRALCNQTDIQVPNEARADEVMCMVYFLLKYCSDRNISTDSLMSVIDKDLRNRSKGSYETYESFFNACSSCESLIPSGYFNQIILSPDQFYEDEGEIDWQYLTGTYNKTIIKDVVNCWNDATQRDIVIDDMAFEVESDYYYSRDDDHPVIIYPGQSREEMLDYLDSLRLSDKGAENKRKRAQSKEIEKTEKTYSLDDPRIHPYQIPFLIHDENNETIITRTAKEINEGRVNPFNVNWMEVTLYDSTFVAELLEIIHSDFIMDVAQAIDDEEARHQREDGQYTDVASNYYGTGQGSANFYSHMVNHEKEDHDEIAAITIAQGILKNRIRAEEYQKKLEQRKLGKGGIGMQIKHGVAAEAPKEANQEETAGDEEADVYNNTTNDSTITQESLIKGTPIMGDVKSNIPKEIAESEDWKKLMKAKLINEDGQPTGSRTEAAILADILLERMGKSHEWTLFEKMWGRKNMRIDFQTAKDQVKYESVRKKILRALH